MNSVEQEIQPALFCKKYVSNKHTFAHLNGNSTAYMMQQDETISKHLCIILFLDAKHANCV